jgi:hypothetical protein
MSPSYSFLGSYPHHEVGTPLTQEFIIPALPEYTEEKKRHAIPDDPYNHSIENSGSW